MRSAERSAGPLRWLEAALTGLLPTPPTPVQITKGLSLWLDEKRGSRHFKSSTVVRLRHFATVLGLIPSSRLSVASDACDRCITALTACVIVALP